MREDHRVEGNLRYDPEKDKFVFQLIPNEIVEYKGKKFELQDLYLNIGPIEKAYHGIRDRLLTGEVIKTSLPKQMFKHLAQRHLEKTAEKIKKRRLRENGEIEDIAAGLYEDPELTRARNEDSSDGLEIHLPD